MSKRTVVKYLRQNNTEAKIVDWSAYAKGRNLSRNRLLLCRHSEVVDHFLLFFDMISREKRVLDIGPGNGLFMLLLRELGFTDIEGLEISQVFLDVLRSKNLVGHIGNIVTGDGLEHLSPPYDVVLMMDVLEHLEDPERALNNARELMANNGLLHLTVPICDSIFDRVLRIKRRISREQQVQKMDETHIHAFSQEVLVKLLERTQFEVREVRRISFLSPLKCNRNSRIFLLLRALLPDKFRGLFLSVLAKPAGRKDV